MTPVQRSTANTLDDAVAKLRRDPQHPILAKIDDLMIEIRVVSQTEPALSAAQAFEQIGPWCGETTDEILDLLAVARRFGTHRPVREL